MSKKNRKTTLEKFTAAKEGHKNGTYKTIEEAAEANDISPATYYNYQNKLLEGDIGMKITEIKPSEAIRNASPEMTENSIILDKVVDRLVDRIMEKLFIKF